MAKSCFETPAWHAAVAGMLASNSSERIADSLIACIGQAVDHNGTCLLAFHTEAPPEVLHHTLEPEGEQHYVQRYLAGPYLLDPLYELSLRKDKPAICRFRDATPDRFHSSEYYRQYCERTHLKDEMDFLVEADEGTTLALVVGRREKLFSKTELARLELIEPLVRAAMCRIWKEWRHGGTRRAPQLLLRGHSTKSVARLLDIAPGTVMVHKRNLFQKLGITSQFELFSRFIEELSN